MGPTSVKFDPEMEDKYGKNPIQAAEFFAAESESFPIEG
jgi:hypothetical protein